MAQVRAKKYLGQHFLKDLEVARRIAESLALTAPTPVLEIGPGTGVLTQFLLKDPNIELVAVELDSESVSYLGRHFPELKVIEADFLKMNLNEVFPDKFCIIGNFPYNISSQIFFKMLENRDRIPCLVGMIQKEVAERMAAKHGNKTYGILSVLMQAFYTIDYLFTVHEHVFDPPPKVKSAVIRLTRNDVNELGCDEQLFKTVVKTAFNQRRKMMRNSLNPLVEKDHPMYADVLFNKRPEQLDVAAFIDLTNRVAQ
ncbi:MAG: 16S rRNA (adenine(1518)-N(6)/adenine(1519)-N(6))-dimethyltransferase RsmA, partial [Paludibacter sp.]|nr:16S rRNA (adenine(1518)-N(6)/adenine(1519)-N(6))-dimethyltransferase RsmA [Paludibacter sp.]